MCWSIRILDMTNLSEPLTGHISADLSPPWNLLLFVFVQVTTQIHITLYNSKLQTKVEKQDEIETWMCNIIVTGLEE